MSKIVCHLAHVNELELSVKVANNIARERSTQRTDKNKDKKIDVEMPRIYT